MTLLSSSPQRLLRDRPRLDIWNCLLSYQDQSVPLVAKNLSFTFTLVETPAPNTPAILVQTGQDIQSILVLHSFPFSSLLGVGLQVDMIWDLPPALRDALLEGVLSILWGAMPLENGNERAQYLGHGDCAELIRSAHGEDFVWLSVELTGFASDPVLLTVGCSPKMLVDLFVSDQLAPHQVSSALKNDIVLESFYTLGHLALPLSDVTNLSVGDFVVLGKFNPNLCTIRIEDVVHEFSNSNSGWTYQAAERIERASPHAERLISSLGAPISSSAPIDLSQPLPPSPVEEPAPVDEPTQELATGTSPEKPKRGRKKKVVEPLPGDLPPEDTYATMASLLPPEDILSPLDEAPMDQNTKQRFVTTDGTEKPDLSNLTLAIDFDLGRMSIPLAEIETWRPGSLVPIDPPDIENGTEVTLRINGQVIANGDLVVVDERLAIRLTRLSIGK